MSEARIRAWLVERGAETVALFVAEDTPHRTPAVSWFRDRDAARAWVEREAAELGAPVVWTD